LGIIHPTFSIALMLSPPWVTHSVKHTV